MEAAAKANELLSILKGLVPAGVGSFCCLSDGLDAGGSLAEGTTGWSAARSREFAGGRTCAKNALAAIGMEEAGSLARDSEGLPQWPFGYTGSISHNRVFCMAVAGRMTDYIGLGLDLEQTNRIKEGAARRVVHPMETDFWKGEQLQASILFSLKEAFYKAQYPQWRLSANFSEMALKVDLQEGLAEITFLADRLLAGIDGRIPSDFRFCFGLIESHVVSLCWLDSSPGRS